MRVFLLSIVAVLVVAASAYLVLKGYARQNAGDTFSHPPSTRVSDTYKPEPSGLLSYERPGKRSGPLGGS